MQPTTGSASDGRGEDIDWSRVEGVYHLHGDGNENERISCAVVWTALPLSTCVDYLGIALLSVVLSLLCLCSLEFSLEYSHLDIATYWTCRNNAE